MKNIITLLSLILFAPAPRDHHIPVDDPVFKKGRVVVSGRVKRSAASSKVIALTYSQLQGRPTRLSLLLDTTGYFAFEFDALQAHDVSLWYERGQAQLFIRPRDSLYVELDSDAFQKSKFPFYHVSGSGAETSRDIMKYHAFNTLSNYKPVAANKTVQQYLADLKKHIAREDSVLFLFMERYRPTEEFSSWARQDNRYRNANFLVDYEYHHFVNKTTFAGNLYDTSIFPIDNANAVVSSWYQYHLWQYVQNKYVSADQKVSTLLKEDQYARAYQIVLQNILKHEPPGDGRNLMCYQILFSLSERKYPVFEELMKTGSSYMNDNELLGVLQEQMQSAKHDPPHEISYYKADSGQEAEMKGDVFQNLTDLHRGKVTYIDFWATWCGPCKVEVPFAMDLHEYFKGKPVVFVNLCLFSDRNMWKRMLANRQIPGENYFFDKDQSELLKSKLKIGGFPTYMIISKQGKLVDVQAPRPSSRDIIKASLSNAMAQ